MSGDLLSGFTRVLEIIITAMVSIAGTYFALRGRLVEARATVEVAKVQNEDDLMTAVAGLQSTYAETYRKLLEDMSEPLGKLRRETTRLREELSEARGQIVQLQAEVKALRAEDEHKTQQIAALETSLEKERKQTVTLRQRLDRIKREIDTGPFKSGPHKIPPKDGD